MSRHNFCCQAASPDDTPQFICVAPEERYIELMDESKPRYLISRISFWDSAELLLGAIYTRITREEYLSQRLKIISKFPVKRPHAVA